MSLVTLPAQTLTLTGGWNLVSFHVAPDNPEVASVLAPILGLYTEVNTIEQGKTVVYRPGRSASANSLRTLDALHGYWIRMVAPATLEIRGALIAPSTPIRLTQGWNIVSFLPSDATPVTEALSSINGLYTEVRGFDVEASSKLPSAPDDLSTLTELRPGFGYLINAIAPATLIYPGG